MEKIWVAMKEASERIDALEAEHEKLKSELAKAKAAAKKAPKKTKKADGDE